MFFARYPYGKIEISTESASEALENKANNDFWYSFVYELTRDRSMAIAQILREKEISKRSTEVVKLKG